MKPEYGKLGERKCNTNDIPTISRNTAGIIQYKLKDELTMEMAKCLKEWEDRNEKKIIIA